MQSHLVAIFGGAVSGAEAAFQMSRRGIRSIVFEQNALPYGKIEDGLPKWHAKLRDKEEANINEKLSHELVTYVPKVQLGKDIHFEEIARDWGFSAILLATGAWRDRKFPVEGMEAYTNKGFYYQNPFIYWFNHAHEPEYSGHVCKVTDGAIVVGGGLASVDVAKVLMIETVREALHKRGHEVDLFTLERGITPVLESLGLSLDDLGLKGCTLVYRRRAKDMPLFPGETDTPEKLAKAETVREKILSNAQSKFLFKFLPNHVPIDKVIENERVAGIVLRETALENGKLIEVSGSEKTLRTGLVISSIGSVPEPIDGIPWKGEVFRVHENECCRIEGYKNVFALGNAVTGRGNIQESMKHGREISEQVADNFMMDPENAFSAQTREKEAIVDQNIAAVAAAIQQFDPPSPAQYADIMHKIAALHHQVGYPGDYMTWINQHLPVRLETLLGKAH